MKTIQGDKLPARLQREVLARFVHRWTHENAKQTYGGKCPGCEQSTRGGFIVTGTPDKPKAWTREEWHAYHKPLTTDAEWLKDHAFHVTSKGELSNRHHFAEPAYMANT